VHVTLIINPHSGRGDCNAKLAAVHTACRSLGVSYQVLTFNDAAGLDSAMQRVRDEHPDRVLVCGGDGTVTAVGTALLHTGIPIGHLPGGTSNSIARTVGVPTRLHEATLFLLQEEPRPFDAVRINERISLLTAGAGFDSDLIATADGELKRRFGVLAYVWAALQNLGQLTATTFEVTLDGGQPARIEGHCLLFANIGRLFGEFDLFLDSRPDDGQVDVAVLTLGHIAEILSLSGRGLMGIKPPEERSAFFAGRSVEVSFSRPLRTQIDGDTGGEMTSMKAEVLPGALQMIRSNEARGPLIQIPHWLGPVADSLMGREAEEIASGENGASGEASYGAGCDAPPPGGD
jgi:diacylglycerol kinase family enzyme